jgi:ABC-type dipeptide/oligopeptide/nickel transport system permease component
MGTIHEKKRMRLRPLMADAGMIGLFGLVGVASTFALVSRVPEGAGLNNDAAIARSPLELLPRVAAWLRVLVVSWGQDWSGAGTQNVQRQIMEGIGTTLALGSSIWLLTWGLSLLGAVFLLRSPAAVRLFREVLYPAMQAVPALPIILMAFLGLSLAIAVPGDVVKGMVGVVTLTLLNAPRTLSLWLNGIERVLHAEHVRVARARGLPPGRLWARHVLPNVLASSGIPTQMAFSAAGMVFSTFYIERVFSLGGVADTFISATVSGHAELATTASIVYFVPLALAVVAARATVRRLDPRQGVTS